MLSDPSNIAELQSDNMQITICLFEQSVMQGPGQLAQEDAGMGEGAFHHNKTAGKHEACLSASAVTVHL